ASDLGFHDQVKRRVVFGLVFHEIQKLPLRHEGQEFAVRGQVRQVGQRNQLVAKLSGKLADLLMRACQKSIEQTELVHDFQSRRMNRVAPKVTQEIGMLFQHYDVDSGARQQVPEHHPR